MSKIGDTPLKVSGLGATPWALEVLARDLLGYSE